MNDQDFQDFIETQTENLLDLSGIRVLHPKGDNTLGYEIVPKKNSDEIIGFSIFISSPYFVIYQIKIDIINKIIKNDFIVSSRLKSGVAKECLKHQVTIANIAGYKYITLLAALEPARTVGSLKIEPLVGYKIWGKYGFIMSNSTQAMDFKLMMQKIDPKFVIICDIYDGTPKGKEAVELWDKGGFPWLGQFDTSENSKSFQVLHAK